MTIAQSGPYTAAMRTMILCAGLSLGLAGSAAGSDPAPAPHAPAQPAAQAATPPDATALASRARRLQTNGQFDEAVALFTQALAIDPELFEAHLGLGYALDLQGRYEPAREHLRRALGRAPADAKATALSALAISYVFDGQTAEAAKRYQQLFDDQTAAAALDGAAATANALARLFLRRAISRSRRPGIAPATRRRRS